MRVSAYFWAGDGWKRSTDPEMDKTARKVPASSKTGAEIEASPASRSSMDSEYPWLLAASMSWRVNEASSILTST